MTTAKDYIKMTTKDLRRLCHSKGIPTAIADNKINLIYRLSAHNA